MNGFLFSRMEKLLENRGKSASVDAPRSGTVPVAVGFSPRLYRTEAYKRRVATANFSYLNRFSRLQPLRGYRIWLRASSYNPANYGTSRIAIA